jgi:CspA family cold shock protein
MSKRLKGVTLWFDVKKGFGFIKGEDGVDYFAHFSKIIAPDGEFRLLEEGEKVEFESFYAERGDSKKPQAKEIRSLSEK